MILANGFAISHQKQTDTINPAPDLLQKEFVTIW